MQTLAGSFRSCSEACEELANRAELSDLHAEMLEADTILRLEYTLKIARKLSRKYSGRGILQKMRSLRST